MSLVQIDWNPGPKVLRTFAWSLVATAAVVAGVFGLWQGRPSAYVVASALAVAGLLALVGPRWMRRPLYVAFTGPAWVIGNVVSRVLVSGVFYLMVTPMGRVARLFGYDPLSVRGTKESYWSPLDATAKPPESYQRPF